MTHRLSPEEVLAIQFDFDTTARITFGMPYEMGLSPLYAASSLFEDEMGYGEFVIEAVYDPVRQLHAPSKMTLHHGEFIDAESIRAELGELSCVPDDFSLIKDTEYTLSTAEPALSRAVAYGWRHNKTNAFSLGIAPRVASRQIGGFSANTLNSEVIAKPSQMDLDLIYRALGAVGFARH